MPRKQLEKEAEEKILEAARAVFIRRGFDGARMQEIADEAGYNKSMLHYYYRDKDSLFHEVFTGVAAQILPPLVGVLEEDLELMDKLDKIVDLELTNLDNHPYMPAFMIQELNGHPERIPGMVEELNIHLPDKFVRQVKLAVSAGEIEPIKPVQLVINVLALCVFPYVGGPMVRAVMRLDDDEYNRLLKERRKILPKFIRKALKPS